MHNLNFLDNLILSVIVIFCLTGLIFFLMKHEFFSVIGVSLILINTKIN